MAKTFCDSFLVKDRYVIYKYYQVPITLDLDKALCTQYYHGFEFLKCAVRRHPPHTEGCSIQLFWVLFALFSDHERSGKEMTSCRNEQIAERFLSLIEDDNMLQLGEESLSGLLNISKRSLSVAVKKVIEQTPREHIMKAKTEKAKRLISTMGIHSSLVVVSDTLGFSSLAAFSRFFKSRTGTMPSEYRNSLDSTTDKT